MIPRNVPQTITSKSITLNRLRAAVEGYITQHPAGPAVEVIPSHIDARGFACGYVQSESGDAVSAIEAVVATQPRRKEVKCFTLESGPRTGQFKLTVTAGMVTRRHEINSRRYDTLVRLANSGDYHVEIYDADYGVAWMIRRKLA